MIDLLQTISLIRNLFGPDDLVELELEVDVLPAAETDAEVSIDMLRGEDGEGNLSDGDGADRHSSLPHGMARNTRDLN